MLVKAAARHNIPQYLPQNMRCYTFRSVEISVIHYNYLIYVIGRTIGPVPVWNYSVNYSNIEHMNAI